MKWKVEAGIPADYWFLRTLNWIYKVTVTENIRLRQSAVVRGKFGIELERSLTKEDARMTLQSFLDTAPMYNLYVLYASYDPSKERLILETELGADIFVYDAIMLAGNLLCQCFGTTEVYWDNLCDFAWLDYFEVTAITVGYEVPIAYITEEPKFPIFVLAGLGMLGLALLVTQPWKQGDWKK